MVCGDRRPGLTPEEVLAECRALSAAIGRFPNRRAWLQQQEGAVLLERAQRVLQQVRTFEPGDGGTPTVPSPANALRYVHWNILHGCSGSRILEALQTDPNLQNADLISLNEVDVGMQRSGNIDVAAYLAQSLGMHAAWCALFLELHGGQGPDGATSAAADRESLFGLCLLSRFPLANPRRIILETPEDMLFDREGKVGAFVGLQVTVQHPAGAFDVLVTHLDVHGSPARRQRQMRSLMDCAPAGPLILSGDLNTTTFARGGIGRALRAFATLALTPTAALQQRLWRPDLPVADPREPLFTILRDSGLDWLPFNDGRETLDLLLKDIQEVQRLPKLLRLLGQGVLQHVERRSSHRLDWIAVRGFDSVEAMPPSSRVEWMRGDDPASDHAPIACTLHWPRH